MKPLTLILGCGLLLFLSACNKVTNTPIRFKEQGGSTGNPPPPPPPPPSSDQLITFFAGGDSAFVTGISVDTSREVGFMWPQINVNGMAIIPVRKDTLTFNLQLFNSNNSYLSVTQFMGNFNDTSRSHHTTILTLSSQVNYNAYQDAQNGANDFYVDVSANDGKALTATFYGSLVCFANNTGAPPTLPITKGVLKINLPHN
jgi:hypothetical protein